MNKIISINLKGIIFQVEEEAYDRLRQYLETLNRHFANDESRLEIIDDIESRLAEMMQEKLKTKAAITMADVEEIVGIMGKPADFDTESADAEEGTAQEKGNYSSYNNYNEPKEKRFFRDKENSLLGGVCSGAGHYFGIDPLWVRLGFLFLFFVVGTGFLFYMILWFIIPEAKTQSDRLRMKGEPVNVDNIEKAVKEEYERVKKNFDQYRREGKISRAATRSVGIIGDIALAFIKFIGKVAGVGVLLGAVVLFIALCSVGIHLIFNGTLPIVSFAFDNNGEFWITATAVLVLLLMMVVGFVQLAIKLFNPGRKIFTNKGYNIVTGAITTTAVVVLVIMGISFGRSFSSRQSVVKTEMINTGDTLTVTAFNPVYYRLYGDYNDNEVTYYNRKEINGFWGSRVYYTQTSSNAILGDSLWHIARFEVARSSKPAWELEIIRKSYGKDDYMARAYAEKIPMDYMMKDNKLVLNTHFYMGPEIPFRDQEIIYRLWVPQGKVLKFEEGLVEIMDYSLKHRMPDNGTYGSRYYGMEWQMGENGLKCLNCPASGSGTIPADAREYHVGNFSQVEVNVPAKVTIQQGAEYSVFVQGPDRVKDNLEIHTRGNTLKIGYDVGLFDIFDGYKAGDVQITIVAPTITGIDANGAANVELEAFTGKMMDIELSGASNLEGSIDVTDLDIKVSGSSDAELVGTATTIDADLSGASSIKAFGLHAQTVSVDASGASSMQVTASNTISGDLSGASHVYYKGNPVVKVSTSGASGVKSGE